MAGESVITKENGGVQNHRMNHRVRLQHLFYPTTDCSDYGYTAAIFSQHKILCVNSPSSSNYKTNKKKTAKATTKEY